MKDQVQSHTQDSIKFENLLGNLLFHYLTTK
jgi:hypothetical protein